MTIAFPSLKHVSDADLLARVRNAVADERHATAQLIALLMELDARRLYLVESCSSLFTYCTQVLGLTEHAAYGRIEAARAARKFPLILDRLYDGMLTLTAVGLLAPHLTAENHERVLDAARHKTKRQVEQLVAMLNPKPDIAPIIRKLPAPTPASTTAAPSTTEAAAPRLRLHAGDSIHRPAPTPRRTAELKPLAPERFKLQVTIGRDTYAKLRRVQDLLRHTLPDGDLEAIIDRALTLLLEHTERTKFAEARRPRSTSAPGRTTRQIPAAVKRAVWTRDGGQCAFHGSQGRCRETGFLEFHHLVPFAAGGQTSVENLELRCRAHNAYEAAQWFEHLPVMCELPGAVLSLRRATRSWTELVNSRQLRE